MEESLARYHGARGDSTGRGRECVVVALTGGPESATLLRRGARLAARADGRLHAVCATRPGRDSAVAPAALAKLRDLTDDLGGSFHTVVAVAPQP